MGMSVADIREGATYHFSRRRNCRWCGRFISIYHSGRFWRHWLPRPFGSLARPAVCPASGIVAKEVLPLTRRAWYGPMWLPAEAPYA